MIKKKRVHNLRRESKAKKGAMRKSRRDKGRAVNSSSLGRDFRIFGVFGLSWYFFKLKSVRFGPNRLIEPKKSTFTNWYHL